MDKIPETDELAIAERVMRYYIEYARWLDEGAPESSCSRSVKVIKFYRGTGLCSNLELYAAHKAIDACPLVGYMYRQFEQAGLDMAFPFNQDGYDYGSEAKQRICHLNPERLAWVRAHLPPPETVV